MSTRLRAAAGSGVAVRSAPASVEAGASRSRLILFGLCVAAAVCMCWSYGPTIVELVSFWSTSEDYSVGALVPAVALVLGWRAISRGPALALNPSVFALIVLLGSQLLRAAGLYLGSAFVERVSLWAAIVSLVPLFAGWRATRRLGGEIAFLLLMVPFPNRVHDLISPALQGLSTALGQFGLELFGYFVIREGNVLRVDDTSSVLVAEACSGLRMLTAFIFTGAVFAILVDRPRWQRVVLLISTVPIAVVTNGIRVLATAMVVHHTQSESFEKTFHDFAGIAMMPIAVLLLFGLLELMAFLSDGRSAAPKAGPRRESAQRKERSAAGIAQAGERHAVRRLATLGSVGLTLLVLGGVGHRALAAQFAQYLGTVARLAHPLSTLPMTVGDWHGVDVPLDDRITAMRNFDDDYVNRRYRDARSGAVVEVFVGYVGRARALFGHRPDVCFAAHGWDQESRSALLVEMPGGQPVPSTLYEFRKPDEIGRPLLVLATYMMNGRYIERHDDLRKWNSRTPGLPGERPSYLARVQVSLLSRADRESDLDTLRDFVGQFAGPVAGVMPYWGAERP